MIWQPLIEAGMFMFTLALVISTAYLIRWAIWLLKDTRRHKQRVQAMEDSNAFFGTEKGSNPPV
ncbi:hypothetical protein EQG49_02505 [Periweissella cryptocerci]|uniref:Uncharacterized protein n=1 Tax=Periweissella cryptocerci TaxID=2506420 RepID=A0A4P6YRX0_9LACO|nr:hypothetical protein [Periweissella cryptocerci]QBO35414.1 hypothetical protein EQG49_02505 [Periweissella cryptocerci]